MANVTGYTTAKVDALIADTVVGATIDSGTGQLSLTTKNGTVVNVGSILTTVPTATTTAKGIVELATDVETQTGTDSTRAVTPFGMTSVVATATGRGLVELATNAETATGTDAVRAVTPAGMKSVTDTLLTTAAATAGYQPLDSDLTAIAALTGTNDNVIQRKSGAWTERTMAQLATDLSGTGEFPDMMLYNGTVYADADGTKIYIGPTDPGAVSNGCVWFDTTGS